MTEHHDTLQFLAHDLCTLRLPDTTSPLMYLTGQMAITDGTVTLCCWSEQDLHGTLRDLEEKTSLALGGHAYLDLFYFGESRVGLVIWEDGHACPTHAIELSESEFFAAIQEFSDHLTASTA